MDSQWLGIIANAVASIIVAVIGLFSARYVKRSAREKKLQTKLDEEKKHKDDKKLQDIMTAITRIDTTLDSLKGTLDEIQDDNKQQQRDIDQVSKLSKIGMDYTREVSNVVSALAEGLRDNNINGNVTRALENYREFESRQLQLMCRILAPDDDDK